MRSWRCVLWVALLCICVERAAAGGGKKNDRKSSSAAGSAPPVHDRALSFELGDPRWTWNETLNTILAL